jgi:hypothetical protein
MNNLFALLLIFLLILLFYKRHLLNNSINENMIGFGRRGAGLVGDSRVFPNRFDAAPYGPYPWADPQWS